ncbi:MAG: hypothetical protein NTX46_00280 [Chloroflexi bacterium]|nr:hypothetical protein [Chloroflexota bacterium]
MNSSRRWLTVFAIVISILVITTVSLVLLTKRNEVVLLPEGTPQGVVQRYLIAVQEKNYQQAYNYLSFNPSQKIKTYDDWLRMVIGAPQISNQPTWKATLGKTTENGDNATVGVIIDTFHPGGPFEDSLRSQQIIFQFSKIDDKWLITSPTYIYWIY